MIAHRPNGVYLRMGTPKFVVVSFPNDAVIVYNHTPHQWVGPRQAQSFPRQFKTSAHVYFIALCQRMVLYL